jgi:hypothetical protein
LRLWTRLLWHLENDTGPRRIQAKADDDGIAETNPDGAVARSSLGATCHIPCTMVIGTAGDLTISLTREKPAVAGRATARRGARISARPNSGRI